MPKAEDLRHTSDTLRRIIELTSGLVQDSQADAAFRERLELAANLRLATRRSCGSLLFSARRGVTPAGAAEGQA